jgi:transcriptional regulator with XRE-family HTH domain
MYSQRMSYEADDGMRAVVAGEVRAHLARRGLSGNEAAMQIGWTQPYLSRRLSGRVPFNVADLATLAKFLEVPVTEFFQVPHARPSGQRTV